MKKHSNFSYRLLSWHIALRSMKKNIPELLQNLGVKEGQVILDYGAGPGAYSIPAAELVGNSGKVYSADIHPMAKRMIEKKAAKKNLTNIQALLVNINTGISNEEVDMVFVFDVLHHISEKSRLMKELHRITKTGGILLILPDHLSAEEVKQFIKSDGLFIFKKNVGEILEFKKIG